MTKTSGVHHVALGVSDLGAMTAFYRDLMGFTEVLAEFGESEQEIMREVTRSPRAVFSGALLQQKAGGILLELIHMVEPAPRPIRRDFRYGDIGVAKITVATADARSVYERLRGGVSFCSEPKTTVIPGFGGYEFVYCRDPEGNLIEIVNGRRGLGSALRRGPLRGHRRDRPGPLCAVLPGAPGLRRGGAGHS